MKKVFFVYLFFTFILIPFFLFAQKKSDLIIGIVTDYKDNYLFEYVEALNKQLNSLLGSKYSVTIPSEKILDSKMSVEEIQINYKQLTEDEQVDIILGFGVITSSVIAKEISYKKPVFLLGIIDTELQGLKPTQENTSGVKNLSYNLYNRNIENDLDMFYKIFPYKNLGIVYFGEIEKVIPPSSWDFDRVLKKIKIDSRFLPINSGIDDVMNNIKGLDAVYVSYIGKFEGKEKEKLFRLLSQKGLPTFGFSATDVELGALASVSPKEVEELEIRRLSLNIEAILEGENASELPLYLNIKEKLAINMKTANLIGFYPSFNILSQAEIINPIFDKNLRKLDLLQVIEIGLNQNIELKLSEKDLEITKKNLSIAKSQYLPSIIFGAKSVKIDDDRAKYVLSGQAEKTVFATASLRQILFSDPVIGNIKINKHLYKSTEFSYQQAKLDLILLISNLYFNTLILRNNHRILQENNKLIKKNLEIAKQRELLGHSGSSDVYRWESQLANSSSLLFDAKNKFSIAKLQLDLVLNISKDNDYELEDMDYREKVFTFYTNEFIKQIDNQKKMDILIEYFITQANQNSVELKQIKETQSALKRRLAIYLRQRFLPQAELSANIQHTMHRQGKGSTPYDYGDFMDTPWEIGIGLYLPIFQGGKIDHQIFQTKQELLKLNKKYQLALKKIETDVRRAFFDLTTSFSKIEALKISAENAKKSLGLVTDSYSKGFSSIAELIDAQNNSLYADLDAVNSNYIFLLNLIKTERSTGRYLFLLSQSGKAKFLKDFKEYLATTFKEYQK